MDNKQIRLANLLLLEREAGSKAELARRTRTNANYLTQITTGHRQVGDDLARDLESGMRKHVGWMDHVHGEAVSVPDFTRSIPLFDTAAILAMCSGNKKSSAFHVLAKAARGTVLTDITTSERTFAMRVEGNAMQSMIGGPSFPMGARIVIDPEREARPGCYVVARVNDDIYFRRLEVEGKRRSLIALNTAYEKIDLPKDADICGVVVQAIVDIDVLI